MVFTGLSAFPLTPVTHDAVDLGAYRGLVTRLVEAGVDSIGALGSTGSYAYLSRIERREVTAATIQCAGGVPVIVGTGALRTGHVQALTEDAQSAGAAAVMVAPVSYQPLTELVTHGSARVAAAIAEHLSLVTAPCLPRPLLGLSSAEREQGSWLLFISADRALVMSYGPSMATTIAPPRAPTPERLLSLLVVVAAMVGIVVAAVPSVLLLADPPDPWFCPAIWPPATSCVPDAHLVVVAAAVLLASVWVAADVAIRRVSTPPARAGIVAGLVVIALIAWSAARTPQPYFSAWAALFS